MYVRGSSSGFAVLQHVSLVGLQFRYSRWSRLVFASIIRGRCYALQVMRDKLFETRCCCALSAGRSPRALLQPNAARAQAQRHHFLRSLQRVKRGFAQAEKKQRRQETRRMHRQHGNSTRPAFIGIVHVQAMHARADRRLDPPHSDQAESSRGLVLAARRLASICYAYGLHLSRSTVSVCGRAVSGMHCRPVSNQRSAQLGTHKPASTHSHTLSARQRRVQCHTLRIQQGRLGLCCCDEGS